jgi:4-amino-4-deoxy-L-arabinose transferase-like glycosyltransferase
MSKRQFLIGVTLILLVGTVLRTIWLRADPPTANAGGVGVVWHDEGPWVHNARNRVVWGVWRTDNWNPMFVAPVFTALEATTFSLFGVGTWQARTVPAASGVIAVAFLMAGLGAAQGRRAALVGGALLATNYVFVMWNRAALMESTMAALIVVSWASYAMGRQHVRWAGIAGVAAVLAFFTKASAAFFLAAIVCDALLIIALSRLPVVRARLGMSRPEAADTRMAWWTIGGITAATLLVGVFFVLPHWSEYRFYNWQMSVLRKPSYGLKDLKDRASWLPVVQGFFSRMWLVVAAGAVAIAGIAARWRTARPAERLLVLWVLVGLLELVIHDDGNERRYVMFIPALIALAALLAGSGEALLPADIATRGPRTRWSAIPLLLLLGYLTFGSVVRLAFLDDVLAGRLKVTVYVSALLAVFVTALIVWQWRRVTAALARTRVPAMVAAAGLTIAVGWNLVEYQQWARHHSYLNYWASLEVGGLLPPGTLVQGKLANGLDLDNRIKPIFIGRDFGNYDDRFQRDDVRYILTYQSPKIGYESGTDGRLITELLEHYPLHRFVAMFNVAETGGPDRAVLIEKLPGPRTDIDLKTGLPRRPH